MENDFIYSKINRLMVIKLGGLGKLILFFLLVTSSLLITRLHIILGVDYRFSFFYVAIAAIASWYSNRIYTLIIVLIISARWIHWALRPDGITSYNAIPWNLLSEFMMLFLISELIRLVHKYFMISHTISYTDHLTGIMNLRGVVSASKPVLSLSKREQHWNSLVYFDIDNFKNVNDELGHDMGDRVLQQVAYYLKSHLRHSDIPARVGGDEFLIVMPNTSPEESKKLIKKIDKELMEMVKENIWGCSFSYGIVTWRGGGFSLHELTKKADTLMYAVKSNGKAGIKQKVFSNIVDIGKAQKIS